MMKRKEIREIVYNGKKLELGKRTLIMGVLNVTPDSFSDGGEYTSVSKAVERAISMAREGADIIDIGGESTRPNAKPVELNEEIRRVVPVLKEVKKQLELEGFNNVFLSVDTYKSKVAEIALLEGADIINDISGLTFDPDMVEVIAQYKPPVVINHTKGYPYQWSRMEITYQDVVQEILNFWKKQINLLMEKGYDNRNKIICDPGIGFGKKFEHNIEILKRFKEFQEINQPLLIGTSRKSFIGIIYKKHFGKEFPPKERLYGSLASISIAVINGADIVRVHDVKETKEFLSVLDEIIY